MVVMQGGRLVFEDYAEGTTQDDAHSLYSGTKSFSCAIAVAAAQDKLLHLDEPVSHTIGEWQDDPQKSGITIRQLLSLTSGIDAGASGTIPSYAAALDAPMRHAPGTSFQYGPVPFQVFGELMRRKLAADGLALREYLSRRVLDPMGLRLQAWRTDAHGNSRMSAGMFLTAREWAKYGQLLLNRGQWSGREILSPDLLAQCFQGTTANPGYGLSFWLPLAGGTDAEGRNTDQRADRLRALAGPDQIIKAAGVGGQKLYIIPSRQMVIVRQASRIPLWGRGFTDDGFLAPILGRPAT